MDTNDQPNAFIEALVRLCKEHNAVLFPRRDSHNMYLSMNLQHGPTVYWLDFKRISGEGAEKWSDARVLPENNTQPDHNR